jgi:hypothetical protein
MLNISVLGDLSTFEYIEIMIMFWKYEYAMLSLNEWCDCMLWLEVLKNLIVLEHECDF